VGSYNVRPLLFFIGFLTRELLNWGRNLLAIRTIRVRPLIILGIVLFILYHICILLYLRFTLYPQQNTNVYVTLMSYGLSMNFILDITY